MMGFSFISEESKSSLYRLFEVAHNNLGVQDEEIKKWANRVRSLKSLFAEANLYYLNENLIETRKWNLFDLGQLNNQITDDDLSFLKNGAITLFVYLKEWEFRHGIKENEQESPIVRGFYDFIYTEKNLRYLDFKTHYDFVDELPFVICGEIYSSSKLNEIRKFLEEKDFSNYRDLIRESEKASDLISGWNSAYEVKVNEVKELEKKLDDYKTTYDFVLLNKGFQQLYDQKKLELKSRREGYSAFGAMLFFTPLCAIALFVILYVYLGEQALKFIIYLALPISTFMVILFYFVRVGLQHVRSVQSQMMQLELRMALCQFIHNYAEDSEKLHAKNKAGFEKFENIIFSPLVSSDDKIPTTFDGMEQLAKLVSEFRK
ncbi:MAG: hypothetical protein KBT36_15945 [Kurthia sp.]|nr:hypothetical protein [Candidatus Kurthia equi]